MIEALREPAHRELTEHARTLRAAIGTCAPINALPGTLAELGAEPGSEVADLLLHRAGPYAVRGDWLETVDGKGGISDVCGELATEYEDQAMSHAQVLELLTSRVCEPTSLTRSSATTPRCAASVTFGSSGQMPVSPGTPR